MSSLANLLRCLASVAFLYNKLYKKGYKDTCLRETHGKTAKKSKYGLLFIKYTTKDDGVTILHRPRQIWEHLKYRVKILGIFEMNKFDLVWSWFLTSYPVNPLYN